MSEADQKYWRCVIQALQDAGMTIAKISEAIEAEDRDLWRWKAGERVPRGITAIKLCKLYEDTCPNRHCPIGHSAQV
jgi:DNA-binding transcriptional MerR regulator